ncbi:regulator of RNase E activity RraB [Paenibacillus phyllosphaerae]|uniref:Regulator of RNase E activity RraB n=1 Tax=Paenibacillus phyllosphaerae TaxID=274593 RepID=A0A7W5FKW0_9BACL|nr:DUF695 domain-containing protein [Paenibacillus phyllosphaerae]MBB3108389.1 regulator of RNase E activity RraB [Paenibacillus phyllosphaerae]
MADEWGFYERLTESEQMRILVNSGYKTEAPLTDYSELLSVTLNLYMVRNTSKSKKALIMQLEQYESKLEKWASSTFQAKYVGRINTATRLEFYYYTRKDAFSSEKFKQWMEAEWEFRAQNYVKEDAEWSFYHYLLPNGLEQLYVHNAHMIYALIHKGDNIGQPRNVYHWLLFREAKDRQEAQSVLQTMGYKIEKERATEADASYPFPLVISRFDDVKLDTVNKRVRELHGLITDHNGRYDGWGSSMKLTNIKKFRTNFRKLLGATLKRLSPGRR